MHTKPNEHTQCNSNSKPNEPTKPSLQSLLLWPIECASSGHFATWGAESASLAPARENGRGVVVHACGHLSWHRSFLLVDLARSFLLVVLARFLLGRLG